MQSSGAISFRNERKKRETNSSSKKTQEVKGYKDSKLCSKFQTSASLFLLGKKKQKKQPTETVW